MALRRESAHRLVNRLVRASGTGLLTSDVFDTILIRDGSVEDDRLADYTECALRQLSQANSLPDQFEPVTLERSRHARLMAARISYSVRRPGRRIPEGRIDQIWNFILQYLYPATPADIRAEAIEYCVKIELLEESKRLQGNRSLEDSLARAAENGWTVGLLSDMYLRTGDIRWLLNEVLPDLCRHVDFLYSSADMPFSKRDGGMFEWIRSSNSHEVWVHIGDNDHADIQMAQQFGAVAVRYRPWHEERPAVRGASTSGEAKG